MKLSPVLPLLLSLALAAPAAATELFVYVVDENKPTRPPLTSRLVTVQGDGEVKVGPVPIEGSRKASLRIGHVRDALGGLSLEAHAFSEQQGRPTGWVSRSLSLTADEPGRLEIPYTQGRYAFHIRPVPKPSEERPAVNLVVRLTQGSEAVAERQLEVPDGSAELKLGPSGAEPLEVTITSEGRDLDGASIHVACAGRKVLGAQVQPLRSGSFKLLWGDLLRITGLEGPLGPLDLDLVLRP